MNTIARRLLLVLGATAAFLSFTLGSAQAVQLYGASGSPGAITPYQVTGASVNTCAPVGTCYARQVQVPGPLVGRSPSSNAAQSVSIQFRLYRWNGSAWALSGTYSRTTAMGYSSSIRLSGVNFNVGAGYYTVQESLTWSLSTNGMTLGSRGVNYNGYDYACNSQLSCSTNAGWVHLG